MEKRAQPSNSIRPLPALNPIRGGIAPGTAPTKVLKEVHLFMGVYTKRYRASVAAAKKAAGAWTPK
jgi:hypothetical protein